MELRKAQAAYRERQKESYGILVKHILAQGIVDVLRRDHFQEGRDTYVSASVRGRPIVSVDRIKLDDLDEEWRTHHYGYGYTRRSKLSEYQ